MQLFRKKPKEEKRLYRCTKCINAAWRPMSYPDEIMCPKCCGVMKRVKVMLW